MQDHNDYHDIKETRNVSFTKCLLVLILLQFILMPKIYMWVKVFSLFFLLLITIVKRHYVFIINRNWILLAIYIFYNIISIGIGIVNGYSDSALRQSTVAIAWPILFLLFIGVNINKKWTLILYKVLIWLTLVICIFDTLILISGVFNLEVLNDILNIFNINSIYGSNVAGFFAIRSDHLYFYAFLIPFMTTILFRQSNDEYLDLGVSKKLIIVVCVYSIIIGIISGMGGVWLAEALGLVFCFFKYIKVNKNLRIIVIFGMAIITVWFVISYCSNGMAWHIWQEIVEHIFVSENGIEDIRGNQIKAMVDLWEKSPFFGAGTGMPVQYWREGQYVLAEGGESSYFVLLYQKGLIGVGLFVAIVYSSYKTLKKRKDVEWFAMPYIVGMMCFLIANAFNPYLANLSSIWILLFPLLMDNRCNVY